MSATRPGCYEDPCVPVSLFHNDSGDPAAEAWLTQVNDRDLWISHWVLLEFASATAVRQRHRELESGRIQVMQVALEHFREERLGMVELHGDDALLARSCVQELASSSPRAADAWHLAVAHRHALILMTATEPRWHRRSSSRYRRSW